MSLLIEGMDMPKNCAVCPRCIDVGQGDETEYFCSADDCAPDIQDITAGRLQTCTLVEVPTPHGDLIDRDRLLDVLDKIILNPDSYFERCMAMATKEILIHQTPVIKAEGNT